MGARSFPGVKSGQSMTLIAHPLLVPWSWKGLAIHLLPLLAVRPVQSLSACTRVTFFFAYCKVKFITPWIWSHVLAHRLRKADVRRLCKFGSVFRTFSWEIMTLETWFKCPCYSGNPLRLKLRLSRYLSFQAVSAHIIPILWSVLCDLSPDTQCC
jgi:hypothetical protein